MENKVVYLVRSSTQNGYLFPDEEEFSDPSQAYSACLAFETKPEPLLIQAINNGQPEYFELHQVCENSHLLYAKTEYGMVYFKVKEQSILYVGSKLTSSAKLNWLEPVYPYELDRFCMEHHFFFVGDTTL